MIDISTRILSIIIKTVLLLIITYVSACAPYQVYSTSQHNEKGLDYEDFKTYGIAIITPSTVTGQEEEKQAVAFTFASVMKEDRPDIRCVTLPETISAINKAGLADGYKKMFMDYKEAGIFDRVILQKIGSAVNSRYLAKLKLASFVQDNKSRFSIFGFRLIDTKRAMARLFLQIWDTENGSIVWEGMQELDMSGDTIFEKNISLQTVLEKASRDLISILPGISSEDREE